MEKIIRLINKNSSAFAFIIFVVVLLISNLSRSEFIYYYDSQVYWDLGDKFIGSSGKFSLLNFDSGYRGYVFPLIIFFIKKIAFSINISESIFYQMTMSLVYAAFFAILIPAFIQQMYKNKVKFPFILIFCAIVFFFHRSLFFYPLSDLLSIFFLVLGVFIILKYSSHWWLILLAGVSLACASLIRPSYLITIPFLLIWFVYHNFYEIRSNLSIFLGRLFGILLGIILIYIPQIIINQTHFETSSPLVQTQTQYEGGLLLQQLNWGIELQKYETNVGSSYPIPQVNFLDRQGESVLIRAGYKSPNDTSITSNIPSTKQYLKLVISYPLDFIIIYARHLFNGLDVVYNSVYVNDIFKISFFFRLFNYSLWFFVLTYFIEKINLRKFSLPQIFLPMVFVLPSLLSIPTAIEVRFMLPIDIIAYILFAFWISPEFIKISFTMKRIYFQKYVLLFIIFIVICFMISSNTYMGLQNGYYVLTHKGY